MFLLLFAILKWNKKDKIDREIIASQNVCSQPHQSRHNEAYGKVTESVKVARTSPDNSTSRDRATVCLFVFVCFESHEQFFSYLATVAITGDRAANLDLCLALTAFSSEGSFTCHTYCDTGPPFLRSYPKDTWFYLLDAVILAKEQSLPILNVLIRFDATSRLLSESTTTRRRQPVGQ
jgi:hypothetical protein